MGRPNTISSLILKITGIDDNLASLRWFLYFDMQEWANLRKLML